MRMHQYIDIKASSVYGIGMRTTLTLDRDVAAALERLRKARDRSFKELVNEALRRGLKELGSRPAPRRTFRTQSTDLGRPLLSGIDNIAETMAVAERETFR
jgi:hypothetical protein